ncbi:nucleotidyltransferase family protein [Halorussus salinisoli]|uniref:nucleotidyltransferase family protein n=1 Tax=Halorussus salinisoli TaxID=2558242 RepID=UPI0010C23B2B|nr:nucleotidyltransferase family protein [Halorussus salinisoli]
MSSKTYFDEQSQEKLREIIEQFNSQGVEYMFLKGWEGLPQFTTGNDIDMFIKAEDFDQALSICDSHGLDRGITTHGRLKGIAELGFKAVTTHRDQAKQLVGEQNPSEIMKKLLYPSYNIKKENPEYKAKAGLHYRELKLDITNHLIYRQAMGENKQRVNPDVEQIFLENKMKINGFSVPNPPCELAHLICRGVFDYNYKDEGTFPDYYIDRCDELTEKIFKSEKYTVMLKTILNYLFFQASDLVYELVENGEYRQIRTELKQFSDY